MTFQGSKGEPLRATARLKRQGVSFYRKEKVCDLLGLDFGGFEVARKRLVKFGLLAFQPYGPSTPNGYHRVLPVDPVQISVWCDGGGGAAEARPDAG